MKRLAVGLMLLAASVLALGCPGSSPPAMVICTLEAGGGGACQIPDGHPLRDVCIREEKGYWCPPSALDNGWATTQDGMESFASWCYGVPKKRARAALNDMKRSLQ